MLWCNYGLATLEDGCCAHVWHVDGCDSLFISCADKIESGLGATADEAILTLKSGAGVHGPAGHKLGG